ncbi:hypothetical protein IMY05_002G0021600 [Salix suchowensis]|nr:hypothetical protein IMY05_002G0021600 [Salix suchowensis]
MAQNAAHWASSTMYRCNKASKNFLASSSTVPSTDLASSSSLRFPITLSVLPLKERFAREWVLICDSNCKWICSLIMLN